MKIRFRHGYIQSQRRGRTWLSARAAGSRAVCLAEAVVGRYAGQTRVGIPNGMTLLTKPSDKVTLGQTKYVRVNQNLGVHLNPHVTVIAPERIMMQTGRTEKPDEMQTAGQPVETERVTLLQWVERVTEQHVRIETAQRTGDSVWSAGRGQNSGQMLPRAAEQGWAGMTSLAPQPEFLVRHAAASEVRSAPLENKPAERMAARVESAAHQPSFQTVDINRITDQVVQALDRRILAYRERLGRV